MPTASELSLERLGIDRVDLYQIHGPVSLRGKAALAEGLASCTVPVWWTPSGSPTNPY